MVSARQIQICFIMWPSASKTSLLAMQLCQAPLPAFSGLRECYIRFVNAQQAYAWGSRVHCQCEMKQLRYSPNRMQACVADQCSPATSLGMSNQQPNLEPAAYTGSNATFISASASALPEHVPQGALQQCAGHLLVFPASFPTGSLAEHASSGQGH